VSYHRNQFIYGNIEQSEAQIPEILNLASVKDFIANYAKDSISLLEIEEETKKRQSFVNRTLVYRRNGLIELYGVVLKGNIIIASETKIKVPASSQLENVILIAPIIEIAEGVKGSFQAFASQQIIVGANCQLAYPTTLVVFDKNDGKENKQIVISSSATVKGIVAYVSDNKRANYKAQIVLDHNAVVYGEIYCQGNLELKGTVNGAVYTNSFIANQSGGIYVNHIYNGSINSEQLTRHYSGLFFNESTKTVVKWLD
ncbi:MAG: hypothetical protein JKY69_00475, partial [Flavobacteriaceae bacterium]|nr:hypothetical protein [Flavobacteriaceae bacterium]